MAKIKERLIGTEDTAYTYEIVESPLPVKNYKATLSVEEDEDSPDRSEIHWEATFDAQGTSEEDAKKKIAEIFEAGVESYRGENIEWLESPAPRVEARRDDRRRLPDQSEGGAIGLTRNFTQQTRVGIWSYGCLMQEEQK
jgi:hypothetical protein